MATVCQRFAVGFFYRFVYICVYQLGHYFGIGFSPANGGYVHVSVFCDGVEFNNFDTSATLGSNYTWGKKVSVYLGVDHGTANVDSAICEKYEYTSPFSWGDEE